MNATEHRRRHRERLNSLTRAYYRKRRRKNPRYERLRKAQWRAANPLLYASELRRNRLRARRRAASSHST